MKQAPSLTRHDLEAKIVKRCWENKEFRKHFTADPVGVAVKHLEVPAVSLPKIIGGLNRSMQHHLMWR